MWTCSCRRRGRCSARTWRAACSWRASWAACLNASSASTTASSSSCATAPPARLAAAARPRPLPAPVPTGASLSLSSATLLSDYTTTEYAGQIHSSKDSRLVCFCLCPVQRRREQHSLGHRHRDRRLPVPPVRPALALREWAQHLVHPARRRVRAHALPHHKGHPATVSVCELQWYVTSFGVVFTLYRQSLASTRYIQYEYKFTRTVLYGYIVCGYVISWMPKN